MKSVFIITTLCVAYASLAQDTITQPLINASEMQEQHDQLVYYVEGHETDARVLKLFKANEITVEHDFTARADRRKGAVIIKVKDPAHPVLQYFDKKAALSYDGRVYSHNQFPLLQNDEVGEVIFREGDPQEGPLLEVKLNTFGASTVNSSAAEESSASTQSVKFFEVNGKILTAKEFFNNGVPPEKVEYISFISGKEAVKRYGDRRYASGVMVCKIRE